MKGGFSVPIGTKDRVIFKGGSFSEIVKILENAEIRSADFEETMDKTDEDNFLLIDPPYTAKHNYNGFVKYNKIYSAGMAKSD
ncbi:hypothetical protein RLOatenuis_6490 [Rickettsiales bacterium]|nr:hypothetical protein RLOatenuis_6490 [Rickettsiales bacterium]